MARLDGKVAVITGGASGMGEAAARLFVEEGARVVIADVQRDKGEAVARSLGNSCRYVEADVAAAEDVQAMIGAAVENWGKLDVLFNNAGIGGREGLVADTTEDVWDRIVAVDLKGVWLGMKYAMPYLVRNGGGSIVTTASIAGLTGFQRLGAYSAAKAGVIGLTRVAAVEYAEHHVRANCICPGGTWTPILYENAFAGTSADPLEVKERLASAQPIPRTGLPEDIANAALWLASDDSSFVTGQAIVVDGGWTASARTGAMRQQQEQ